ncbi:MAG: MFS transporter [Hyphomicrobiales bacterium]|nr:MFS transporter [Hyphomicrobiales bacterium]
MLRQFFPIIALFMSTAFLQAGGGVQAILIPVRAQIEGFSTSYIALIGTSYAIGFTLGCLVVPLLVRRVGHVRTFGALSALLATVMLLNGLVVYPVAWIILRAISGLCFAGSYMIIESWLNERISNDNRGSLFSIYMIVSLVTMMCGQYLLVIANPQLQTLFMVGAILYALAVLPTALSRAQSPAPLTRAKFDLVKLYFNSPAAVVSAIVAGLLSGAWANFAPVFAKLSGMSNTNIANILVFAMIGSIIFQMPIGRLSDRMDRRFVMIGASFFGALAGFLLAGVTVVNGQPDYIFFAGIILFGGFIYSIYSLAVAHANDHANPEDFVETASGLLILFGIGSMIGPMAMAPIMDALGPNGLFTGMGAAHILLAAFILFRVSSRALPKNHETVDFQSVPIGKAQTPETYVLDPRADAENYGSND